MAGHDCTSCRPIYLHVCDTLFVQRPCSIFYTGAFVRTNRRATAMMFVRLSVSLSGTGVYCDHTVHFSADLSLWLDSLVLRAP